MRMGLGCLCVFFLRDGQGGLPLPPSQAASLRASKPQMRKRGKQNKTSTSSRWARTLLRWACEPKFPTDVSPLSSTSPPPPDSEAGSL